MFKTVGIIGAGIQGVCTAFHLQKKVLKLRFLTNMILEKMASYGNAGHFSPLRCTAVK